MSEFKSDWFELGEPTTVGGGDASPAFARGDGYNVTEQGGTFTLSYLSGELAGRGKDVRITSAQATALRDGAMTLDAVLIAQGVN